MPLDDEDPADAPVEDSVPPAPGTPDVGVGEAGEPSAAGGRVIIECQEASTAVGFVSLAETGDAPRTEREDLCDGLARLAVPPEWFGGATSIRLVVGVAGVGVVKTMQAVDLCPGETRKVVISPDAGLALCGRLLDPNDCGIPGVRIVARTRNRPGAKQKSQYDSDDLLYSAHPLVEARAVTEVDGSFRVSGLQDRAYFLTTADARWVIVPTERPPMNPPMENIELRAVRSYQLDVSIRDIHSRELIPHSSARIHLETDVGSTHFVCGCANGRNIVVWPPRGSAMADESGFTLSMKVSAFGYQPRYVDVRFAPFERAVSRTVELIPRPMGELAFDISAADGGPVPGQVSASISRLGEGYALKLEKDVQTGTYRHRAPAGSWTVSVRPRKTFGTRALEWKQVMVVHEGGVATARVQFAPFGSLVVDRGKHPAVVFELKMDGRRVITALSDWNSRIRAIRAGVWPYVAKVAVDGVWQVVQVGTIEVRGGEESLLKIE